MSDSLKSILHFIELKQEEDGSFLSESRSEKGDQVKNRQTTFFTAQILLCLNQVATLSEYSSQVQSLQKAAATFLLKEKSSSWSWNYWAKGSKEYAALPYPDDLDDTFLALTALFGYQPELITGEALAHTVTLLTQLEVEEGGPYKTWLVPEESPVEWKDVDVVVNARIAHFLEIQGVRLPKLRHWLREQIKSQNLISPYYPSNLQTLYALSQLYSQRKLFPDLSILSDQADILTTAAAVTTHLRLGGKSKDRQLQIAQLEKSTVWPWSAFCRDPKYEGVRYLAGASALTAAFVAEALVMVTLEKNQLSKLKPSDVLSEAIKKQLRKQLKDLPEPLYAVASSYYESFLKQDKKGYKILLPQRIAEAWGITLTAANYEELGLLNLHGWVAYTLYDQIWDNQAEAVLTGAANWALRQVVYSSQRIESWVPGFAVYTEKTLQIMEAITTWEVQSCRFDPAKKEKEFKVPDYQEYYCFVERALGESLCGCAVLATKYALDGEEVANWLKFFSAYTIARQLNDEAHDWEEDLQNGHVNAVAALLLSKKASVLLDIEKELPILQERFWQEVLPIISRRTLEEVEKARKVLIAACQKPECLLPLLERPESAAKQALREQQQAKEFLSALEEN